MSTTPDPYTVLGVLPTATAEEIEFAYRRLAMAEHPDRGGSTERMTEINLAYERLSDAGRLLAEHEARWLAFANNASLNPLKLMIAGKTRHEISLLHAELSPRRGHSAQYAGWLQYLASLLDLEPEQFDAEHEKCRELLMATVGPHIAANASDHTIEVATKFTADQIQRARAMFKQRQHQE